MPGCDVNFSLAIPLGRQGILRRSAESFVLWLTINRSNDTTAGEAPLPDPLGYALAPLRPLAGLVELQSLRDKMVHASPKRATYRSVHKEAEFPKVPSMWLYREAPAERVRKHIADVQAFAEQLHAVIRTSEFRFVIVDSHPFLGALSFGTGSVESAG